MKVSLNIHAWYPHLYIVIKFYKPTWPAFLLKHDLYPHGYDQLLSTRSWTQMIYRLELFHVAPFLIIWICYRYTTVDILQPPCLCKRQTQKCFAYENHAKYKVVRAMFQFLLGFKISPYYHYSQAQLTFCGQSHALILGLNKSPEAQLLWNDLPRKHCMNFEQSEGFW